MKIIKLLSNFITNKCCWIRHLYIILLLPIILSGCCDDIVCIRADDTGQGGPITIPANIESSKLLLVDPPNNQVARWIDSGYNTVGVASSGGKDTSIPLLAAIKGEWNPWGGVGNSQCSTQNCASSQAGCLTQGNATNLDYNGEFVPINADNVPCALSKGFGVYGLIAIINSNTGKSSDPNDSAMIAANPDPQLFRTFHVGPSVKGDTLTLKSTLKCVPTSTSNNTTYNCSQDTNANGEGIVAQGRLYFKVLDSYYLDNSGGVVIDLISGIYQEGIVTLIVKTFSNYINKASQVLFQNFLKESKFLTLVKTLILLYISLTFTTFLLGISNITKNELVMRLLKISIVMVLLINVNDAFNFFNLYLISWFNSISQNFSDVVMSSLYDKNSPNSLDLALPAGASYLTMYDTLIKQITSASISNKIWSLLFTSYFYYIPLLYFCLLLIMIIVFKLTMYYILAIFQIALLVTMLPIFIIMILFKFTTELFQNWLKYMSSSALLIIVSTATAGLMFKLLGEPLGELFHYKVCYKTIIDLEVWGITLLKFCYWKPDSMAQMQAALEFSRYLTVLMITILFNIFISQVPPIADSLSNAAFRPSSRMASGALANFGSLTDGVFGVISKLSSTALNKLVNLADATKIAPLKFLVKTAATVTRAGIITATSFSKDLTRLASDGSKSEEEVKNGTILDRGFDTVLVKVSEFNKDFSQYEPGSLLGLSDKVKNLKKQNEKWQERLDKALKAKDKGNDKGGKDLSPTKRQDLLQTDLNKGKVTPALKVQSLKESLDSSTKALKSLASVKADNLKEKRPGLENAVNRLDQLQLDLDPKTKLLEKAVAEDNSVIKLSKDGKIEINFKPELPEKTIKDHQLHVKEIKDLKENLDLSLKDIKSILNDNSITANLKKEDITSLKTAVTEIERFKSGIEENIARYDTLEKNYNVKSELLDKELEIKLNKLSAPNYDEVVKIARSELEHVPNEEERFRLALNKFNQDNLELSKKFNDLDPNLKELIQFEAIKKNIPAYSMEVDSVSGDLKVVPNVNSPEFRELLNKQVPELQAKVANVEQMKIKLQDLQSKGNNLTTEYQNLEKRYKELQGELMSIGESKVVVELEKDNVAKLVERYNSLSTEVRELLKDELAQGLTENELKRLLDSNPEQIDISERRNEQIGLADAVNADLERSERRNEQIGLADAINVDLERSEKRDEQMNLANSVNVDLEQNLIKAIEHSIPDIEVNLKEIENYDKAVIYYNQLNEEGKEVIINYLKDPEAELPNIPIDNRYSEVVENPADKDKLEEFREKQEEMIEVRKEMGQMNQFWKELKKEIKNRKKKDEDIVDDFL